MKNKSLGLLGSSLIASGIVVGGSIFSPAQAFNFGSFTPTNAPVGNPDIYTSLPTVGISSADIGQSFTMNWSLPASEPNANNTQNINSTGTFKVNSLNSNNLELQVTLTNTTVATYQAALMSLGLGVAPDATATLTQLGTKFNDVDVPTQQNFPGGFKDIDVCAYSANGCAGGNINQGLQSGGNSDTFILRIASNTLNGFGQNPEVTLSSFAVKYQTQDGSYEIPGNPGGGGGGSQPVPEPTTMLGLLAVGSLGFLKKKSA
jgi:hypothetical protein